MKKLTASNMRHAVQKLPLMFLVYQITILR